MFENPVLGFASPKKDDPKPIALTATQQPHYRNPKFMSPLDSESSHQHYLEPLFVSDCK